MVYILKAACDIFSKCTFIVFVHSHYSHKPHFQSQPAADMSKKALINPLCVNCSAPNNTDRGKVLPAGAGGDHEYYRQGQNHLLWGCRAFIGH